MYGPPDPLGEPSGSAILVDGKEHELTFRELEQYCKNQIRVYDSMGRANRLRSQVHHDPHYRPIDPGSGWRKARRWRG